jgi:hypothetical protein
MIRQILLYPVSTFLSIKTKEPDGCFPLGEILERIRSGFWKDEVLPCREDKELKTRLPVFTPTGIFRARGIAGMEEYNGLVCLDIDNVPDPVGLKETCNQIAWVCAAFVTPGGQGVKVIIPTEAHPENYRLVEEEVAQAFHALTGYERDRRCKDISRIQYVSYDPDLLVRESCRVFGKADYVRV